MKSFILRNPILSICSLAVVLSSCNRSYEGKLIATQVPYGKFEVNTETGDHWRYLSGAQLVLINPAKKSSVKVLTKGFFSACSPDVSCDGKSVLFAAQQKENDPWQIWQMDLGTEKYRKITDLPGNCTDPAFLPGNRMIFTRNDKETDGLMKTGHELMSCNADGTGVQQITFHPHADFASTVLKDGRLLFISQRLVPEKTEPELMVARPDGTKSERFYKGINGTFPASRCRETDGVIYFVESDSNWHTSVVSVQYNRPLHSRETVSDKLKGRISSIFPAADGKFVITYKADTTKSYEVFYLEKNSGELGDRIAGSEGYDLVEVVGIEKRIRPKKLPSEVDMGVKTGLLLYQDINYAGLNLNNKEIRHAVKIEIAGIDSCLGIIDVEKDGSVYLKIIADQPFMVRTLDQSNNLINDYGPWLWLRPNERRGFVGFCGDEEMAPRNLVPIAVKKDPKIVPVVITDIHEKEVELE